MIAVDTNMLVYAHRAESEWYEKAGRMLRELAEGGRSWAIPWPCLCEFYAVVTNKQVFNTPTPVDHALMQITVWLESPTVVLLGESATMWPMLRNQLLDSKATGPLTYDARIAALCLTNGVRELWTADRDFGRFPALRSRNPLVSAA